MVLGAWRRRQRRRDFAQRSDGDLRIAADGLGHYITVHPLADETQLLEQLNMTPDDCQWADCYWHHRGDVAHISVRTAARSAAPGPPGFWWARNPHDRTRLPALIAVLDVDRIDTPAIDTAIAYFARNWPPTTDAPTQPQPFR